MKGTMGVLLDDRVWRGIRKGRTGHERLSFYNKAAKKNNIKILYFSLPLLRLTKGKVKGYVYRNGTYKLVNKKIPKVIHNRSMSGNQQRLAGLCRRSFVFNERTRYSKYKVHRLLTSKTQLRPHLPSTKTLTKENLKKMMKKFDSLYLKPVSSSVGKGIMRLDRINGKRWRLKGGLKSIKDNEKKMVQIVHKKLKGRNYLISETIPLAKYKNKPFDIRVSVQKSGDGDWQITGMVGKVAAKGSHVTNVARGGKVKRCEQLFSSCGLNVEDTKKEIERVSLKFAERLGEKLSHLADIGLDVGVDSKGHVYFIEMNGRDLRYSFGQGGLKNHWYKTYENPIKYGKYLLKKEKKAGL